MTRTVDICMKCVTLIVMILILPQHGSSQNSGIRPFSNREDCVAAKAKYDEGVKLINFSERRAAFQRAVDLCPKYAEAHVNLADALEHLGLMKKEKFEGAHEANKLLDEAIRHYTLAVQLKPDLLPAQLGMADVFMAQGRYPLAAESYRKVLKMRPGYQGVEARLREAENRSRSTSLKIKTASEITSDVKSADMNTMYKTMGFEEYVIKDSDRQSFNNILFEGWSAAIRPGEPVNQLNEIGKALASEEMSSYRFIIEGHANAVGEFDRNMTLSNERATAVKEYLVNNFSIDKDRMITQGFGYTRPKHNVATDASNRRVEIVFFNEGNKP